MIAHLVLSLAALAQAADTPARQWGVCVGESSGRQLSASRPAPTARIVEAAFAACRAHEAPVRQTFVRERGAREGATAFEEFGRQIRAYVTQQLDQERARLGR